MYSQYLQDYIAQVSTLAQVDPQSVGLLNRTLGCFLSVFGRAIHAETEPAGDLFETSFSLLMLDSGLASLDNTSQVASAHYLIGMGFEQSGELISRLEIDETECVNGFWTPVVKV